MLLGDWKKILAPEFEKPYFQELQIFLEKEYISATVYPKKSDLLRAFELCEFEDLKVVLLGQDPYHGKNQAHGLSFSVPIGQKIPPSLQNIFKELQTDLHLEKPKQLQGDLSSWAKQGVLLLNAILSVRANEPASHQKKGWELFSDFVISEISNRKSHLVFLLWGNYAISKIPLIDKEKHYIIQSAHPSPLAAHRGFLGSQPFSKCNQFLQNKNLAPIHWASVFQ